MHSALQEFTHRRFRATVFSCLVLLGYGHGFSQECPGDELDVSAKMAQAEHTCDPLLLYRVAAIKDGGAVVSLREVYLNQNHECEQIRLATRNALAKLGDSSALDAIRNELIEASPSPGAVTVRAGAIHSLAFIGDDRAIAIMMEYMRQYENKKEPVLVSGDYEYRPSAGIVAATQQIAQRRNLKDYTPGLWDWKRWWEQNKSGPVSTAIYEAVSDPLLRCLAREVEWGFPSALLEMAIRGGKPAEAVLRRFPRYPTGYPRIQLPLGSQEGNIQVALAILGDKNEITRISQELGQNEQDLEIPVLKLDYIGGKDSVNALVMALGVPTKGLAQAQADMNRTPRDKYEEYLTKDRYRVESEAYTEFQSSILQALSRMVKDPPLSANPGPSMKNIQTWKDWWASNKDNARFRSAGTSSE